MSDVASPNFQVQGPVSMDSDKEKILSVFRKRARASGEYMRAPMQKASRMYRIYRSVKSIPANETADESLEPNISVGYAFGIVENLLARSTEPMFNMKPPWLVQPKRAEDTEKAENFKGYARKFYSRVDQNLNYILSNRECLITGWAWEADEYAMKFCQGKRWTEQPIQVTSAQQMTAPGGQIVTVPVTTQSTQMVEQDYAYPDLVGFNTRYPSVFDIWPEPGIRNTKDMHWLIEQQRNVALEDLRKEMYEDPQTGQLMPVYDLSEIDQDKANSGGNAIRPCDVTELFGYDLGSEVESAVNGISVRDPRLNNFMDDLDRVHVYRVVEPDKVTTIANGKYVISVRDGYLHRPKINYRLKVYTQDNLSPFGIGAIEPVEDMLAMLDDTQNLTMQNWIRLVNKMTAVKEDAIVSFDDFSPRAGGVVRLKGTHNASDVIFPYDHADSTGSMLNHQSNLRGLMEWKIGAQDYSPGTGGTKQEHKTLGGQAMIQENMSVRFATSRMQFLAYSQDQGENMQNLLRQYQFSPTAVLTVDEYGKSETSMKDREDILAEDDYGFAIEHDPSFGSESVLRQFADGVFESTIEYNKVLIEMTQAGLPGSEKMPIANIAEAYRKKLQLYGYSDTSQMLKPADGTVDPSKKFQAMAQGQPFGAPNPKEDLLKLIMVFVQGLSSPEFQKAVQTGKIQPQAVLGIQAHLQAAQMMASQALQNPQGFAQAIMMAQNQSGMVQGNQA